MKKFKLKKAAWSPFKSAENVGGDWWRLYFRDDFTGWDTELFDWDIMQVGFPGKGSLIADN